MPMYNFNCPACGHDQGEKLVKSYDSEVLCPMCNEPMVKGMSSGSSFTVPYSQSDWQSK